MRMTLAHCVLMDSSFWFKTINLGLTRVSGDNLKKNIVFFLKIHFALKNSVDPDKMTHYASFHLGH